MPTTSLILDRLAVIKLEATLWSGRKKLRPEDLHLGDGSELPPPDLATLGSKRIADPKDIQIFARLKQEGERACQRIGTRFLGGYAVPETELPGLTARLETLRGEFEAARFDFLSRYDQAIAAWANGHPDYAEAIRRSVDPVGKVAHQLGFDYVVFQVKPPASSDETLDRKIGALKETLFSEVGADAKTYAAESLSGRTAVTRRALTPLRRIRDKLQGLSFLDPAIEAQLETLNELLDRVPRRGEIRGSYLLEIERCVLNLAGVPAPSQPPAEVHQAASDPWNDPRPGIVRIPQPPLDRAPRKSLWF